MEGRSNVVVRCDVFLKLVEELDNSEELAALFGRPVSRALVVVADNNDLRIEDGGGVPLTAEERKRFIAELNRLVSGKAASSDVRGVEASSVGERVRTRCDVLADIIRALGSARELKDIYGGSVLENLVVAAEGGDLRIENSGRFKLTEGQSSIFLGVLNRIIGEYTT